MELIDIRQLRAFQLLAETGSFTEAARRMFLTQSAVSHSIKALEASLDCALLERGGKKIALTAEGDALRRRADRILGEMGRATAELQALAKWGHGRLRLGATDTMCEYLLPGALREFRTGSPNCDISVQAADSHELMDMLEAGEIDLALAMASKHGNPGFHFKPLFRDRIVFVVAPDHPWAEKGIAPEEDLQNQRYIIYSRKSTTFRLIERGFGKLGIRPASIMELGNMGAIKEMSKIGLGVGMVSPWLASADVKAGTLIEIEIPGQPVEREWGLFSRKTGTALSEESFAGICKKVAAELCG